MTPHKQSWSVAVSVDCLSLLFPMAASRKALQFPGAEPFTLVWSNSPAPRDVPYDRRDVGNLNTLTLDLVLHCLSRTRRLAFALSYSLPFGLGSNCGSAASPSPSRRQRRGRPHSHLHPASEATCTLDFNTFPQTLGSCSGIYLKAQGSKLSVSFWDFSLDESV